MKKMLISGRWQHRQAESFCRKPATLKQGCLRSIVIMKDIRSLQVINLEEGTTDVTRVDKRFTETVPSATQMGKVYARLIETVSQGQELVPSLQKVYASPICDVIDNYNSSAYYEPSYVQARAYRNGCF